MTETKTLRWFFVTNDEESEIISSEEFPKMRYEGGKWSSSIWAHSREELIGKHGIQLDPCVHCGRIFSTNWCEPIKSRLLEHHRCFTCDFWLEHAKDNQHAVVVNGCRYQDSGRKTGNQSFLGFGGREWIYQKDGEEPRTTNNMWFQGEIPQRFLKFIPDNARFLSREEYVAYLDSLPSEQP